MAAHTNISAYILCGGKSTRMQQEKGLVLYKGKPFVQHIIDAVKPLTESLTLVTSNAAYHRFGYPLLGDIYKDKGPVGGIYSALHHSQTDQVLVLSCDIPNITTQVLERYLFSNSSKNDITYLVTHSHECPLVGIYAKHLVPVFKNALHDNALRLLELIQKQDTKTIQVAPPDEHFIRNINTQQELESLIHI